MKILSALFDVVILPLDIGKDALDIPCGQQQWKNKSDTRERLERIEDELGSK